MPAVGVVDGVGVVGEVFEGVEEGGEADYLGEGVSGWWVRYVRSIEDEDGRYVRG